MARKARRWIQSAIKRPGALTEKARRAGMSPMEYARRHASDPGRTGKQARLALTLQKLRPRGRRARAAARKAARTRARHRR
jgi:hypothetical protein